MPRRKQLIYNIELPCFRKGLYHCIEDIKKIRDEIKEVL